MPGVGFIMPTLTFSIPHQEPIVLVSEVEVPGRYGPITLASIPPPKT
jgi:hypothetical protein